MYYSVADDYKGSGYYSQVSLNSGASFVCWSALRTGKAHFPESTMLLEKTQDILSADSSGFGKTWNTIQVHYDSNCTDYVKTATNVDVAELEKSWHYNYNYSSSIFYKEGDCHMGRSIFCTLHDEQPAVCRLNVRMSAAFILAACLVLKATYMLCVNLLARGKLKSQCLTFGDVIVASASDPELRVQG